MTWSRSLSTAGLAMRVANRGDDQGGGGEVASMWRQRPRHDPEEHRVEGVTFGLEALSSGPPLLLVGRRAGPAGRGQSGSFSMTHIWVINWRSPSSKPTDGSGVSMFGAQLSTTASSTSSRVAQCR